MPSYARVMYIILLLSHSRHALAAREILLRLLSQPSDAGDARCSGHRRLLGVRASGLSLAEMAAGERLAKSADHQK